MKPFQQQALVSVRLWPMSVPSITIVEFHRNLPIAEQNPILVVQYVQLGTKTVQFIQYFTFPKRRLERFFDDVVVVRCLRRNL